MNFRGRPRWRRALAGAAVAALPLVALLLGGCGRVAATIESYSPADPESPLQVEVGQAAPLSVTVANAGNRAKGFTVRCTVWEESGVEAATYEKTLDPPLAPGEQTTVSWNHPVRRAGAYWVQFTVSADEDTPLDQEPASSQRLIVAVDPAPPATAELQLGERVRVAENLNVRTAPGVEEPEVEGANYPGYVPAGSLGNVVDGPRQADGYTWWKVEFDRGVTGWAVEEGMDSLETLLGGD
ncbi:MAG: CARDB domain-containing protein [Candidatus Bipolaricaulaceae bacterium]